MLSFYKFFWTVLCEFVYNVSILLKLLSMPLRDFFFRCKGFAGLCLIYSIRLELLNADSFKPSDAFEPTFLDVLTNLTLPWISAFAKSEFEFVFSFTFKACVRLGLNDLSASSFYFYFISFAFVYSTFRIELKFDLEIFSDAFLYVSGANWILFLVCAWLSRAPKWIWLTISCWVG